MYNSNSSLKKTISKYSVVYVQLIGKKVDDRHSPETVYIRFTPPSWNLVNGENSHFFDIPREDTAISLKDSFAHLDFDVTHRAGGLARYADADRFRKVYLGPINLFDWYRLTCGSGKK